MRLYMRRARYVMALDAIHRQSEITFGNMGDLTVDIEADETCFKSWSESYEDEETKEMKRKYFWYIWFGLKQRGSVNKLWLKSMGVRCSHQAPTVPQLSREEYLTCLQEANFGPQTNAVMLTDAAPTFVNTGHVGVVDAHQVNHSAKEFARSIEALANVKSREVRPAMASTNMLDSEWKRIKTQLQDSLSAKTEAKRDELGMHIRAAQWRRMTSTEDPWRAWCAAAQKFRDKVAVAFDGEDDEERNPAVEDLVEEGGAPQMDGPVDVAEPPASEDESDLLPSPVLLAGSILGPREEGVPEEVHAHMESLAQCGAIPVTQLEQRKRNKRVGKTEYGVPQWLAHALKYGYISPNLEAPKGYKWKYARGQWQLCAKGG